MAEPNGGVLYADTSALVELVVREAESDAIEAEVSRWGRMATSEIAAIELPRAAASDDEDGVIHWLLRRARLIGTSGEVQPNASAERKNGSIGNPYPDDGRC